MIFTIKRIRKKDSSVHERELRRKGHRVKIEQLELGLPLILTYIDDGNKVLKTSSVEAFNSFWKTEGHLIVQTKNSVYSFVKEGAV